MSLPRKPVLAGLVAAGVAAAVLVPASSASAMNPCDADNPPDYCYEPPPPPPPTVAPTPAMPSNLKLTSVLQTNVTLQWTDNSTNETAWRVQRDTTVGSTVTTTYQTVQSTTTSTTGTASWTDTSATPGAYTSYRIAAVNADPGYDLSSTSSAYGPISATTKPKPANPYLSLSTAASDDGVTSVWIHGSAYDWDTTGSIQVQVWNDGVALPNITANAYTTNFNLYNPGYGDWHNYSTYVTKTGAPGQHTICVQPVDVGGGVVPARSCRTYTVYDPVPASNVKVAVGATTVTVTFTDNANDETGWYLQRSTDGRVSWYAVGNAYAPIAGTGGTGSAVDYSTPASGTCYRILMVSGGSSTASAAACTP